MLFAAAYAHAQLPHYTAGMRNVVLLRAALVGVGIAFGWVSAAGAGNEPIKALLLFATGFGAAHVPAALTLLLKRQRGEGRS